MQQNATPLGLSDRQVQVRLTLLVNPTSRTNLPIKDRNYTGKGGYY